MVGETFDEKLPRMLRRSRAEMRKKKKNQNFTFELRLLHESNYVFGIHHHIALAIILLVFFLGSRSEIDFPSTLLTIIIIILFFFIRNTNNNAFFSLSIVCRTGGGGGGNFHKKYYNNNNYTFSSSFVCGYLIIIVFRH